jgi:hypothetical protein
MIGFDGDPQALQCLGGTAPVRPSVQEKNESTAMFINAGLVTNTSATLFTFLLSRACPASGPSFTIGITAKKTAAIPMPYAGSVTAGSKSSTKMWLDHTPYNTEFHHRNQVKHGSWIFQFQLNQ